MTTNWLSVRLPAYPQLDERQPQPQRRHQSPSITMPTPALGPDDDEDRRNRY